MPRRITTPVRKLHTRQQQKIEKLLRDVWQVPPERRAAELLLAAGFTSVDVLVFSKSKRGRALDDVWTNNTANEMRDLEYARQCAGTSTRRAGASGYDIREQARAAGTLLEAYRSRDGSLPADLEHAAFMAVFHPDRNADGSRKRKGAQ